MKLALIGKDISHSKSQDTYEQILNRPVDYTLLDYEKEKSIPDLTELFKANNFSGLSVTAPYKKYISDRVINDRFSSELKAVNCVKFYNEKLMGINTDFLACLNILTRELPHYEEVIILGNGAMFRTIDLALRQLDRGHINYSRSNNGEIENLDLSKYKNSLIINSCSRGFNFNGRVSDSSTFWDLNYSHEINQSFLSNQCEYIDGIELLKLQAIYALEFWGLN